MSKDQNELGRFTETVKDPANNVIFEIYKGHNGVIADSISNYFKGVDDIDALEFGGGPGALVRDIKALLPDKRLHFTNIDKSSELLKEDIYSEFKINSSLEDISLDKVKKTFDLILMRYVLQYNSIKIQEKILKTVKELLDQKGLFLLQHVGTVDGEHSNRFNSIFSTDVVSNKLKRSDSFWTTWEKVEALLKKTGFKTKILEKYKIPVSTLYKSRYMLSSEEEATLHDYLKGYDYLEYVISENTI